MQKVFHYKQKLSQYSQQQHYPNPNARSSNKLKPPTSHNPSNFKKKQTRIQTQSIMPNLNINQSSPNRHPVCQTDRLHPNHSEMSPFSIEQKGRRLSHQGSGRRDSILYPIESVQYLGEEGRQKSKSAVIYEDIIRVLQRENDNLKEQNQYLLIEYKKVKEENFQLKDRITKLQSTSNSKIRLDKIKEISSIYEQKIQKLKYILLEELSAINKKINLVMSGEDRSVIAQQLTQSLKRSSIQINKDLYTFLGEREKKSLTHHRRPSKDRERQAQESKFLLYLIQQDEKGSRQTTESNHKRIGTNQEISLIEILAENSLEENYGKD